MTSAHFDSIVVGKLQSIPGGRMAKKVFNQKKKTKSRTNQNKGYSSKKNANSKQAAKESFGDKVRGYWQRMFK